MRFKDKTPFYTKRLEEERANDKRKIYTISLNMEEQAMLIKDMEVLNQAKDSTALKQVYKLGHEVLHSGFISVILQTVLANLRKNKRIGIIDVRPELPVLPANVEQKKEL